VHNAEDLNHPVANPVGDNERATGHDQFARTTSSPLPSLLRKIPQSGCSLNDLHSLTCSCARSILSDPSPREN
jgi:hypothetical protein